MPITITRATEVAAPLAESWASIGTADGLARWLGTDLQMDGDGRELAVGAVATIVDDLGARRRLVVTELDEGHRIGFTWWDDDEPAVASQVTLGAAQVGDRSTITVTETIEPAALGALAALGGRASSLAPAAMTDLLAVDLGWGDRLDRLVRCIEPALALVGV